MPSSQKFAVTFLSEFICNGYGFKIRFTSPVQPAKIYPSAALAVIVNRRTRDITGKIGSSAHRAQACRGDIETENLKNGSGANTPRFEPVESALSWAVSPG
jgi:hypothetical protein